VRRFETGGDVVVAGERTVKQIRVWMWVLLLVGGACGVPGVAEGGAPGSFDAATEPGQVRLHVEMVRSSGGPSSFVVEQSADSLTVVATAMPPEELVRKLLGCSASTCDWLAPSPDGAYDVKLRYTAPQVTAATRVDLAELLCSALGCELSASTSFQDVLLVDKAHEDAEILTTLPSRYRPEVPALSRIVGKMVTKEQMRGDRRSAYLTPGIDALVEGDPATTDDYVYFRAQDREEAAAICAVLKEEHGINCHKAPGAVAEYSVRSTGYLLPPREPEAKDPPADVPFEIHIDLVPSTSSDLPSIQVHQDEYTFEVQGEAMYAGSVVGCLLGVSKATLSLEEASLKGRYDLSIRYSSPHGVGDARLNLTRLYCTALGRWLIGTKEWRDVFVATQKPGGRVIRDEHSSGTSPGGLTMARSQSKGWVVGDVTSRELFDFLEPMWDIVILDEVGIEEKCRFFIGFGMDDHEPVIEALEREHGIILEQGRKRVTLYSVSPRPIADPSGDTDDAGEADAVSDVRRVSSPCSSPSVLLTDADLTIQADATMFPSSCRWGAPILPNSVEYARACFDRYVSMAYPEGETYEAEERRLIDLTEDLIRGLVDVDPASRLADELEDSSGTGTSDVIRQTSHVFATYRVLGRECVAPFISAGPEIIPYLMPYVRSDWRLRLTYMPLTYEEHFRMQMSSFPHGPKLMLGEFASWMIETAVRGHAPSRGHAKLDYDAPSELDRIERERYNLEQAADEIEKWYDECYDEVAMEIVCPEEKFPNLRWK
jgi:hypothetical protein